MRDALKLAQKKHPSISEAEVDILDSSINNMFKLKFIGAGGNGSAYTIAVDSGSNPKPFGIIKFSTEEEYQCLGVHELAIGLLLNKLRAKIPNFMYMYCGFHCYTDYKRLIKNTETDMENHYDDKKVKYRQLECKDDKQTKSLNSFIVQEMIYDGMNLNDYILELIDQEVDLDRVETILNHVFLQVAHALNIAQKEYKYMHFDLHHENILIRRFDEPQTIILKGDSYNITLKDVYEIPFIIDYGSSVITCKDGTFLPSMYNFGEDVIQNIMEILSSTKSTYFCSTFDIFRYTVDILVNCENEASESKKLNKIFSTVFSRCMKIFKENKNLAVSYDLKQFLESNLSKASSIKQNGCEKERGICYGSDLKDRKLFQIKLEDWIRSYANQM